MKLKKWNQFQLVIEKFEEKTFKIYHRTRHTETWDLSKGFKTGGGAFHGAGLYSTQDLKGQFSEGMVNAYGKNIIEYEVKNTGNFSLIFLQQPIKNFA